MRCGAIVAFGKDVDLIDLNGMEIALLPEQDEHAIKHHYSILSLLKKNDFGSTLAAKSDHLQNMIGSNSIGTNL